MIPEILIRKGQELEQYYQNHYPALAPLAKQCFLNTVETTIKQLGDGSYFVITGDIPAMWLRDSAAQIRHYIKFAAEDEQLAVMIRGIIEKQYDMVLLDPYANAFNEAANGSGHHDRTERSPWVWERKYEVDSLCAPLYLSHWYWQETGDGEFFKAKFPEVVRTVLEVFRNEQDHGKNSGYFFERFDCEETDTLPEHGRGNPVIACGMTWSGFRPSDDRCVYGYLIPANMMAVKALEYAANLLETAVRDADTAAACRQLASEIRDGIIRQGVVEAAGLGTVYAYETDGQGNYILMDDANIPSLLAIPYLDFSSREDELYQRTRSFVLSSRNPFYYSGTHASGVGSPHTPAGYVWCIGIIMQALTSGDRAEILKCLEMLANTHGGTNYMHESFDPNRPSDYTRPWFAWANSLFAELLLELMDKNFFTAFRSDKMEDCYNDKK